MGHNSDGSLNEDYCKWCYADGTYTYSDMDDQTTYLGNQLESEFGGDRCFGILANMDFIIICTYGEDGADPELVLYKKR